MRIIHGSSLSPYVRKVLIVLEYKNLSYKINVINPFIKTKELLDLNPLGKIPIYQEDEFILPDSKVICAYLDRQYPQNAIYPSEPKDYALSLWYQEYIHEKLAPEVINVAYNLLIAPKFLNQPGDLSKVEQAFEKLIEPLSYLEGLLQNKKYLVNETFSIADITLFSFLINFRFTGHAIDEQKHPNLARYLAEIEKEAACKKVFDLAFQRLNSKK